MDRYLCIHGHFYQPPRENPWLEAVEIQDSAHPYHDWNERITAECYASNDASRILNDKGRIKDIVSNYSKISFNIGPTLLSWLDQNDPDVYHAIIEADRQSARIRSGHGSALAQAYNHMIMPLANKRDKVTQTLWGIADFRHRFGRDPEGMWLPETAVDLETLEVLSQHGIIFTILSPYQAKRVRAVDGRTWKDVSNGSIDPKKPYKCLLPSGNSIAVFFYDGPVSQAVAFEHLLNSGEGFANRLLGAFSSDAGSPQLMHIATDGESYGHHHKFGDMALAYALQYIEQNNLARITNYGEYLEKFPPKHIVEIVENSSWSCMHGVKRWQDDCGCSSGANPGWNQLWRRPLRDAMDWLRDSLNAEYENKAPVVLKSPWGARNDYIGIVLDRTENNIHKFAEKHIIQPKATANVISAIKMLEAQRNAMLMYTSCGWFFDDITGIETVQVLQYASRAIQLAGDALGLNLQEGFLKILKKAQSNIKDIGDGADVYGRFVIPSVVDLKKVAAHYAISSLYELYPLYADIYCYSVRVEDYQKSQSGAMELVTGKCTIKSNVTLEQDIVDFSLLHLGNHDFNCSVRTHIDDESYLTVKKELVDTFDDGAFADLVRITDRHFKERRYSLNDLFKDEQRDILTTLITETIHGFEDSFRKMYEDNKTLMWYLKERHIPVVRPFLSATEYVVNLDLKRLLSDDPQPQQIDGLLAETDKWDLKLDRIELEYVQRLSIETLFKAYMSNPVDPEMLNRVHRSVDIALKLPFDINLWKAQNYYFLIAKKLYWKISAGAPKDPVAKMWAEKFKAIGEKLHFDIDTVLQTR